MRTIPVNMCRKKKIVQILAHRFSSVINDFLWSQCTCWKTDSRSLTTKNGIYKTDGMKSNKIGFFTILIKIYNY